MRYSIRVDSPVEDVLDSFPCIKDRPSCTSNTFRLESTEESFCPAGPWAGVIIDERDEWIDTRLDSKVSGGGNSLGFCLRDKWDAPSPGDVPRSEIFLDPYDEDLLIRGDLTFQGIEAHSQRVGSTIRANDNDHSRHWANRIHRVDLAKVLIPQISRTRTAFVKGFSLPAVSCGVVEALINHEWADEREEDFVGFAKLP